MNIRIALSLCLLGVASALGQVQPPDQVVVGTTMASSATITLRSPIFSAAPMPPRPPFTLARGTHLQLVVDAIGVSDPVVTWYKDDKALPATGTTLDIPSATAADSGRYYAVARSQQSTVITFSSDTASVLIVNGGQRLVNASARGRIDANLPVLISGFVIERGPAQTMVLVRAVGPTLGSLGVSDPLATPQLRVLDSAGRDCQPVPSFPVDGPSIYPTTDQAAARVGAFPLTGNGKDAARLYLLGEGAYTAHVSSSVAGNTGAVLVEIYEVPL